ncbi:C39 family peptidase [Nonomuraea sp. NPDC049129]|uniref:C39 family peptidase n=1 Tax=Nonomuraea sp. NPDC049129 TaxID=3155272 RepID=UPI0033E27250
MDIVFHRAPFTGGQPEGVAISDGLVFASAMGETEDGSWEFARWTSEKTPIGFGATELIASWIADTPPGTWIEIDIRGTDPMTRWYVLGQWAYGDDDIKRASVPGQSDMQGSVAVDTLKAAAGVFFRSYQLRVVLYRRKGSRYVPTVRSVGTMASAILERETVETSRGGAAWGIELQVPRRSQHLHDDHYPKWVGGGRRWCSPASTTMVLGYWGAWPSTEDTAWVRRPDPNPEVDYAARHTYDHGSGGVGNWPFNIAYAGRYGLDGFVTRLRSLTEAESLIAAGIPLVVSTAFYSSELEGSGYDTNGHLMVVAGFTAQGDVIANDPAAPDNEQVRRVYPRGAFEKVWLRSKSSGGIVYVIRPISHALPPTPPDCSPNW